MHIITKSLPALLALAAGAAMAQSGSTTDPLDPTAAVPPAHYRSAMSTYRSYREPVIADWRETNSQVGRLGGHAGHLKPAACDGAPSASGQAPFPGAVEPRHHGSPP